MMRMAHMDFFGRPGKNSTAYTEDGVFVLSA